MSRKILILIMLLCLGMLFMDGASAQEMKYQNSMQLMQNAWNHLNRENYDDAIVFSDECIRRFGKLAAKMQGRLDDYPQGPDKEIHSYYALNDVATALYIKAEALKHLNLLDEAKKAYEELLGKYSFGQCWDTRGWFWKPAIVAREKLAMIETGKFYDFGDYSSMQLMVLAWRALDEKDKEAVLIYTKKCIELYAQKADQMQSQLKGFPKGTVEEIHSFWALNDVATAHFIQGEVYFRTDELDKAKAAYQRVIDDYSYAQCWDPRGWFWEVIKGAEEKIKMIDSGIFMDFWDYTSTALATKAWKALDSGDFIRALGYADKCIALYSDKALQMQNELNAYPEGSDEEIHAYWALNDVATAHFIKGKVYTIKEQEEKAQQEFKKVIEDYSFGQCWDPKGWWWKPALEAKNWVIE